MLVFASKLESDYKRGYDELVANTSKNSTDFFQDLLEPRDTSYFTRFHHISLYFIIFESKTGVKGVTPTFSKGPWKESVQEMIDFYNGGTANYFPYKLDAFPEEAPPNYHRQK